MLRFILYTSLLLVTAMGSAQIRNTEIYINDSYQDRLCPGGTGFCPKTVIKENKDKTAAIIAKTADNKLKITLEKSGFSTKEWDALLITKLFPVDKGSNIKIDSDLLLKLHFNTDANKIVEKDYPVIFERDSATFEIELETP
jgi:hypothetical protein